MGYEIGAIKYFIGVGTSFWGIVSAYLYANGLLNPMDYIEAIGVVATNLKTPDEMLVGLLNIFITTPSEFAKVTLFGLALMTVSWYIASKP